jgi:hypothetical protein
MQRVPTLPTPTTLSAIIGRDLAHRGLGVPDVKRSLVGELCHCVPVASHRHRGGRRGWIAAHPYEAPCLRPCVLRGSCVLPHPGFPCHLTSWARTVFYVERSGSPAAAYQGQADAVKRRSDRTIYAAVAAMSTAWLRSLAYATISA